ncbi:MAG: DUF4235 domain-containing protein [Candidatus Nanopelagicales bacterium]
MSPSPGKSTASSGSGHSAAASTVAKSAAPALSMGAAWAVRKAMIKGYEHRTGKSAPLVYSREASLKSKVLWAATVAAAIALIEAIIWQAFREE